MLTHSLSESNAKSISSPEQRLLEAGERGSSLTAGVERVSQALNYATKRNVQLHAFTCFQELVILEQQLQRACQLPLQGLLVGIKDNIDTADLPTEYGSPIHRGFLPRADAAIVTALKRAGAVVLGKTVTTEFAFLNPAPTLSPFDHLSDRTPGGSSSGSAAAVSAGLVPLAVGTQTGGSVIRPASYCGVIGFKPSFGVLPTTGVAEFARSLDTLGFFAHDLNVLVAALASLHPHFSSTSQPLRAPRVGVLRDYPWGQASELMHKALADQEHELQRRNIRVEAVSLPGSAAAAWEAFALIQNFEAWQAMAWHWDHAREALSPVLHDYLKQARQVTFDQYQLARRQVAEARVDIQKIFERVDLLLLPSAPGGPPHRGSTGVASFNRLWTAIGTPALSLPRWASDADGMRIPLGMQWIAGLGRDAQLLGFARHLV